MKELIIRSISGIFIVLILLCFIYSNYFVFDLVFLFILASLMSMEWGCIVSPSPHKNKWFLVGTIYVMITLVPMFILKTYPNGNNMLMWLFLMVWCVDTFAYLVGGKLKLGKHKINKISPNKSYEGLAGGIIAATIICYIFAYYFIPEYKLILLLLTPLLCCIEQVSDFTESYVKRKFNIKDSGNIIPGHGGFLDRFDGFLFLTISFLFLLKILY